MSKNGWSKQGFARLLHLEPISKSANIANWYYAIQGII